MKLPKLLCGFVPSDGSPLVEKSWVGSKPPPGKLLEVPPIEKHRELPKELDVADTLDPPGKNWGTTGALTRDATGPQSLSPGWREGLSVAALTGPPGSLAVKRELSPPLKGEA